MRTIERPEDGEFAGFYAAYISRVPDLVDAPQVLRTQEAAAATVFAGLDDERASYRYQPDKWSIKEMLGHLCDAERIFAYRLLRIARGDATPLPGFDENDYVRAAGSDARSLAELTDEWRSVRHATVTLVTGLADDAAMRRGTMNGNPITVRALAYIIVGHVDHHLNVLRTRYSVA